MTGNALQKGIALKRATLLILLVLAADFSVLAGTGGSIAGTVVGPERRRDARCGWWSLATRRRASTLKAATNRGGLLCLSGLCRVGRYELQVEHAGIQGIQAGGCWWSPRAPRCGSTSS